MGRAGYGHTVDKKLTYSDIRKEANSFIEYDDDFDSDFFKIFIVRENLRVTM
tara:strand:+ start:23095 stop:23250 length:156 start_codon:yes stop_codon:yes gene_type:complete